MPVDPDTDDDVGEKEDPIECDETVEWGHLHFEVFVGFIYQKVYKLKMYSNKCSAPVSSSP